LLRLTLSQKLMGFVLTHQHHHQQQQQQKQKQ
jgi:hypothetical protein